MARVEAALASISTREYERLGDDAPKSRAARRSIDGYARRPRENMLGTAVSATKPSYAQGMVDIAVATSALPMVAMFSPEPRTDPLCSARSAWCTI